MIGPIVTLFLGGWKRRHKNAVITGNIFVCDCMDSVLFDPGQTPPVFSAPAPQVPGVQHAVVVAPHMDASLEIGTFPRLTTGPIMTSDQHELFSKFLKLKPPVFKGAESEDAYNFLLTVMSYYTRWV